MTIEIELTQGKVALVDDADYPLVAGVKWHAHSNHGRRLWYAEGNVRDGSGRRIVKMHRVILGLSPGDGIQVDHRNHDGLDNRRANLRVCTHTQNMGNSRKHRTREGMPTTSLYKGVTWKKREAKWMAQINHEGRKIHIGYYTTEEEAADAYARAAVELYGEYAHAPEPAPHSFSGK